MSNGLKGFAGASIYSDDVFPAIVEIEATKEHRRIASKAELPTVPFFFVSCNVGEEVSVAQAAPVVEEVLPVERTVADVVSDDVETTVEAAVTDPVPEVSALSTDETKEVTK